MNRRRRRTLLLGLCLLCAVARPARASGHIGGTSDAYLPLYALLFILGAAAPSEIGAVVNDRGSDARFDLGWAWQIPMPSALRHRIIGGVDYLPTAESDRTRGRIGYRYSRQTLFAGAAAAFDHDGLSWSPEVGIKFLHRDMGKDPPVDLSLHLLVRADLAPRLNGFRGVSILLGWNLF